MDGYGIFIDSRERIYEGTWKGGNMDGYGLYKWSDGRKYLGNFKKDKREGFGIFFWREQLKIYVGFWFNGEQSGYGKIYTPIKEKNYLWYKGKPKKFFYDSKTDSKCQNDSGQNQQPLNHFLAASAPYPLSSLFQIHSLSIS